MPPLKAHSKFSIDVINIVAQIPKGKLMTYSKVAEKAGSPRAYRAVGSILNRNFRNQGNQLPGISGIPIPCHRVVRADGHIGDYAKGPKEKEKLLEIEGHVVENGKLKLMNLA
ncbi:TPA: methylated-DNA--[protein]-cysteine S-methyltransferase [Candidatus Berkelbacteria bacterium]|uniref:Methylated-DNA--protein-cysteine methyltransferase n=1 Tax=Berkelbacteria bacterium GW2011_GWE1_39_12 TaxID=1618337 RepID=A0A0G4B562_9BACT|nr:MAG: methylated-DNA--protein-cysteine methyltransferase [Berkelbacteria bacterium GW2011_GWE1_39_12]HBO60724.1 methylated-DNA--[protein]-cysteine S-methyltransferase [Candidatus Berkelbacteria bacterium]